MVSGHPWRLAIGESCRPHVVLLDIGIPDMDGYAVARQIRSDARFGEPVLVAVIGWSDERDMARSTAAGFDPHLAKPVDIAQLGALLRTTDGRQGSANPA